MISLTIISVTLHGCSNPKTVTKHEALYSNQVRIYDRKAQEMRETGDEQAAKHYDKLADDARDNYFESDTGLSDIIFDSVVDNVINAIFK